MSEQADKKQKITQLGKSAEVKSPKFVRRPIPQQQEEKQPEFIGVKLKKRKVISGAENDEDSLFTPTS